MATLPKLVSRLIDNFSRLPGIGPKSAARIVFYLLEQDEKYLSEFADQLGRLQANTRFCSRCHNLTTEEVCGICADSGRDPGMIMVVEDVLDLIAFERTDSFNGYYHVLHGLISPLKGVGPEQLTLEQLFKRLKNNPQQLEVIIATSPNLEGEATAMFIKQKLSDRKDIKISRIARGVPTGADLDYTDKLTLSRSLEGRTDF